MEKVHGFADGLELFRDLRNTALSIFYSFRNLVCTCGRRVDRGQGDGDLFFSALGYSAHDRIGGCRHRHTDPGGIGSLHYALFWGLERVSDSPDDSLRAAAILIWAIRILPVTLLGFLALARRGLDFRAFGTVCEPEREHPPG